MPFISYLIKVAEQFFHQNNWSPNLSHWLGAEIYFLCRIPTSSFGQKRVQIGVGEGSTLLAMGGEYPYSLPSNSYFSLHFFFGSLTELPSWRHHLPYWRPYPSRLWQFILHQQFCRLLNRWSGHCLLQLFATSVLLPY